MHLEMKIMRSDFHIPSAPAASMNQFQKTRKDKTRFAYSSLPSGSSFDWKRLVLPAAIGDAAAA